MLSRTRGMIQRTAKIVAETALPVPNAKDVEIHSLSITQNLASCLQIFHLIKARPLFWADAISSNHRNPREYYGYALSYHNELTKEATFWDPRILYERLEDRLRLSETI